MSDSYLLDTQVLLWMGLNPSAISAEVKAIIQPAGTPLYLSVASIWEIAIKKSLGKLKLPVPTSAFLNASVHMNGIEILNIDPEHAIGVEELERIHGDPFDRLLISQARHLGLTILSSDEIFDRYKVARIW